MNDTEAERRKAISRLDYYGQDGWTKRTIEEYVQGLSDIPPNEVDQAISRAILTRAVRPKINQLRELIQADRDETQERRRAAQAHRDTGDGKGCPHCRHQHGDHAVDAGHHEPWRGDGKLIYCETHRVMWPGTTHDPNTIDDGGPMNPDEWRDRALAGEYGHVLQTAAARGATPSTAIPEATPPIRLDEALA